MNLSQLTVNGFKSFSDSGQIINPGNLTGAYPMDGGSKNRNQTYGRDRT